jgi:DNA-binding NarL/FixJ family response regulator
MGLSQHTDFLLKDSTKADQGRLPPDAISFGGSEPEAVYSSENLVVVVDKRALERECLARGLVEHNRDLKITAVGSLDEFKNLPKEGHTSAILVVLGAQKVSDQGVRTELSHFVSDVDAIPVIVVADSDEPAEILAALESGARGYVPTNVNVRVAAEAISLARAGGIFVPASSILRLREVIHAASGSTRPLSAMFTTRQAGVVAALRQGKPNKIIAYDLNLCESAVKVHIRNIMKKLTATNRTEIAYKIGEKVA